MYQKLAGLTLIEIILIMTIMAVVGAMTVPQMVVAADEASANARWEVSVAAKDSRLRLSEQDGISPTVTALADYTGGNAVAGGIEVNVDGKTHTVPTFTNALCNEPTRSIKDKVGCVGSI